MYETTEALYRFNLDMYHLETPFIGISLVLYEDDTPLPNCVAPTLGLAYCVPFYHKNNHFLCFYLHKEKKITDSISIKNNRLKIA